MPREKFIVYISNCVGFPSFTPENLTQIKNGHNEEWYKGAWKVQTEKLLKDNSLVNPIEYPIFTKEIIEFLNKK